MHSIAASFLVLCVAGAAFGCAPAGRAALPPPSPVFASVTGTWGWVEGSHTCATNPHTIRFSPDWRYMDFSYPQPVDSATGRRHARYEVRGHTERSIRAFLLYEDRRDAGETLVEWDLILVSPDLYVWRRSDWPPNSSTNAIQRCGAQADAAH
jgi:hypothetical protein